MNFIKYKLSIALSVIATATLTPIVNGQGLQFATQDQLRTIPLAHSPYSGKELPASKDLSHLMPPPGQQGKQNSCVGWATAYALKSYHEKVELRHELIRGNQVVASRVFSPSYIYNQINQGQDGGSTFKDAFNILSEQGVATWEDMPYTANDFRTRPNANQRAQAKRYKIDTWRQVNVQDVKEMKAQINAGYPIVIGATIYQSFKDWQGAGTFRQVFGKKGGGHAMIVTGYDDSRKAFRILNSWGANWGDRGYCWIDYRAFQKIVREGYIAKDAINGVKPITNVVTNNVDKLKPIPRQPTQNDKRRILLQIGRVTHNVMNPLNPRSGKCMLIQGRAFFPLNVRGKSQIVIQVFHRTRLGKGLALPSLSHEFSTVGGKVAAGTGTLHLQGRGGFKNWDVYLPYAAVGGLAAGWQYGNRQPFQYHLVAEPVLYLDGFGVGSGGLVPFILTR